MGILGNCADSLIHTFADKPGMDLAKDVQKKLVTVEEDTAAGHLSDQFVQTGDKAVNAKTGAALSMMPQVAGGFKEGDIVLRANSEACMAESGLVETLLNFFKTGKWNPIRATVSHSGIVVKDHTGAMSVVQMVSSESPPALESKLTAFQKKIKACFLQQVPVEKFFNDGAPTARGVVMRPADQTAAKAAAQKAQHYVDTQVTPTATHPWYSKTPHSLAPDGRGGVCSTFVDECYNEAFHNPYHLPTTPEHFLEDTSALTKVGDRRMTQVQALN